MYRSLFILFYLFSLFVSAQEFSFEAKLSQEEIRLDQNVKLTIRLVSSSAKIKSNKIEFPSLDDFEILGNNTQSVNRWINGKREIQWIREITLRPKRKGVLKIKPAVLKLGTQRKKTKVLRLKVTDPLPSGNFASERQQDPESFLLTQIDNNMPWVNQGVVASVSFYTSDYNKISSFSSVKNRLRTPSFKDFAVHEFNDNTEAFTQLEFEGENYFVINLAKYLLYPRYSGKLIIDSFTSSLFESIDFFENREILLRSKPIEIVVKALPSNPPEGFDGAVGSFERLFTLNQNKDGGYANWQMVLDIVGTGNFKSIGYPKIPINGEELEIYPPKREESFVVDNYGMRGNISFAYSLVPLREGKHKIVPEPFVYFDPTTAKYISLDNAPPEHFIESLEPFGVDIAANLPVEEKLSQITQMDHPSTDRSMVLEKYFYIFIVLGILFVSLLLYFILRKKGETQEESLSFSEKSITTTSSNSNPALPKEELLGRWEDCTLMAQLSQTDDFLTHQSHLLIELNHYINEQKPQLQEDIRRKITEAKNRVNKVKYAGSNQLLNLDQETKEMNEIIKMIF